ncbi:MAG: RNA pseudouridine synthase [Tannerella sp.]|nr:RNA pseudouridine synthase [Tannerella sp.]
MEIIYEDNHLIAINKSCGEIVQGDKTGDIPLSELLKAYLKEKYNKPGNAFVGIIHRLDRPVTGMVVFARTSKALYRMNELFRKGEIRKRYLAIVRQSPPTPEGELIHWIVRNESINKSYASDTEQPDSKKAILRYRLLASSENYHLLEIDLKTGRHHQIRCQLAKIGCPIKGDLKYGSARSNPGGGISLHAQRIAFSHPVTLQPVELEAAFPGDPLWQTLFELANASQEQPQSDS